MTLPCGTLSVTEPCAVAVTSNDIGVQVAKALVGASIRDRTLLDAGEEFFVYILDDAGQYIVDDIGQYIIG